MFTLKNKTILVTGGAGFLGQEFVRALKEAGANVISGDLPGQGADVKLDITNRKSIERVISDIEKLDVLVNNAAIDPKVDAENPNTTKFDQYPDEAMQQSVDVNIVGTWRISQIAVRKMLEQGSGNIINIASIYGVVPPHQDIYANGMEKPADYGMTKAAIIQLTKHIAALYGKKNIRSNAIVYGGVARNQDEEFRKRYGKLTMLGRMVELDEVGAPLVFLASDASKGITGHSLVVDGGLTAW